MTTETETNSAPSQSNTEPLTRIQEIEIALIAKRAKDFAAIDWSKPDAPQKLQELQQSQRAEAQEQLHNEAETLKANKESQDKLVKVFETNSVPSFATYFKTVEPDASKMPAIKRWIFTVDMDEEKSTANKVVYKEPTVHGVDPTSMRTPKSTTTSTTNGKVGGGSNKITVDGQEYASASAAKVSKLNTTTPMNRETIISKLKAAGHTVS